MADIDDRARLEVAAEQWRNEGWALLEGLVPPEDITPALAEAQATDRDPPTGGPTRRSDEHARRLAAEPEDGAAFRGAQFSGTTLFPIRSAPHLNRLFVHPSVTTFARLALGSDDLRLYQSRLWSKFGDRTNYEQPLHRDQNHSLVPTRSDAGYWFLETFLYLNDVDETNGAPRLVPRSKSQPEPERRRPVSRKDEPALYEHEQVAVGPAGSLLAYRSDVWHRGIDLAPGTERHVAVLAFKLAGTDWIGFDAHPPLVNSPDFVEFANSCGPEELALLGVPRPGHPYWTDVTIAGMQNIYPELDLSPWWDALR